jgi:RNA polymerase sigma-70 factor (ECF subfamily)
MANSPESTCWTLVEGAAAGQADEQAQFASRYAPVVRSYLAARWAGRNMEDLLDDAVQDVFVECFRQGGALARLDPTRPGGFRAFLYGVVRNVALRVESRRARSIALRAGEAPLAEVTADETTLSRAFDRTWAQAMVREAAQRQLAAAARQGEPAQRRVELLRLRFEEGLPIREIAERWGADATQLHRDYAKARQEFKAALLETVAFHHPGTPGEVEREAAELLKLLGS